MTQLALTAIGRDRPGIVAEVTRALFGHSLNITDSHMGVLGGRFSMMLIVEAPEGRISTPCARSSRTRSRLDLDAVALHPLTATEHTSAADPSHIVTVYGVDHPGIVHAVCARLASKSVNVTDLETRLVGDGLYAMVLEVALPPDLDPEAMAAMLADVGSEQGVEVTVRPLEPRRHVIRDVLLYPHPALKQAAREARDPAEIARVSEDLLDDGVVRPLRRPGRHAAGGDGADRRGRRERAQEGDDVERPARAGQPARRAHRRRRGRP